MPNLSDLRNPDFVKQLSKDEKILFPIVIHSVFTIKKLADKFSEKFSLKKTPDLIKGSTLCIFCRLVEDLWGFKTNTNSYARMINLPKNEIQELLDEALSLISLFCNVPDKEIEDAIKLFQESEKKSQQSDSKISGNTLWIAANYILNDEDKKNAFKQMEASVIISATIQAFDKVLFNIINYDDHTKEEIIVDFFTNYYNP